MSNESIDLLDGLTPEEARTFLDLATLTDYEDGEAVITEGEDGDALFIVASGSVRILKSTLDHTEEELTTLASGECFGELSLVDRRPRSATVRAAGAARVYEVTRPDMERLFEANPRIQGRVLENLVRITGRRLRNLDDLVVRSLYDSVIRVDAEFTIARWDRVTGAADLVPADQSVDDVAGRRLFQVAGQLGEGLQKQIARSVSAGRVDRLQLDYPLASGEQVYLELTIAPNREGLGPTEFVLGVRNISETKSLETQLMQAEKLAMAGQMSAEIGHELNNYLAVVFGHADLLLMLEGLDEQAARHANAIKGQLSKIQRFTTGLMDFAVLRPRSEPTDLNDVIRRLIQFIQGQSRFRQVTFEVDLGENLPLLQLDPGQIQQLLLNLYSNAADAMVKGVVTTTTAVDRQSSQVRVDVMDTGPGMPDEVKERIFDSGYTTKSTGHGFGLAVCARIAENSRGGLTVESEAGKGTTFTLTLKTDAAD